MRLADAVLRLGMQDVLTFGVASLRGTAQVGSKADVRLMVSRQHYSPCSGSTAS